MKYVFGLFILLLIPTFVSADGTLWEFKLSLDKETYLLEEDIWLDIYITNISDDTLKSAGVIKQKGGGFLFSASDCSDNPIDYTGNYQGVRLFPKTYLIPPGDYLYACYNLKDMFSSITQNRGCYNISAVIDLPFESDCYFDDLQSNILTFEVVEPTGNEQRAFNLRTQAREARFTDDKDSRDRYYQALLDSFPHSAYAAEAFDYLSGKITHDYSSKGRKNFDYIKFSNQLLFRYPDSYDVIGSLNWILYKSEELGQQTRDIILNSILNVSRGTRLWEYTNQKVKKETWPLAEDSCYSVKKDSLRWKLDINLEKENYFIHEPIDLEVEFTNITDDTLKNECFIYPNHFGFSFIIINEKGDTLKYTGPMICTATNYMVSLIAPGETVYRSFNIPEFYGTFDMFLPTFKVGSYTVQAQQRSGSDIAYIPYQFDDLTSETLNFNVIEPDSAESEVLKLVLEARNLIYKKKSDSAGVMFQMIVDSFPNSVYSDFCYDRAKSFKDSAFLTGGLDQDQMEDIIDRYPNSSEVFGYIRSLTSNQPKDIQHRILDRIIAKHPKTRAAKYAQTMLITEIREKVRK